MARVELSRDALLGVDRGLGNMLAAMSQDVLACCAGSAALPGMQCLCLAFDVNFTAFSSVRVNL